jgi:ferredoxin
MPASVQNKFPDNAPGAYYVDSSCYDCGLCVDINPKVFTRNRQKSYSFVALQPQDPKDISLTEDALITCPCGAIGNDG